MKTYRIIIFLGCVFMMLSCVDSSQDSKPIESVNSIKQVDLDDNVSSTVDKPVFTTVHEEKKEKRPCDNLGETSYPRINGNGLLVPVDFSDDCYSEIKHLRDTITKEGWRIEYLTKDDSTKYHDLYIRWTKGERVGLLNLEHVLLLRSSFIPEYIDENNQFIFLKSSVKGGDNITVLTKTASPTSYEYPYTLDFSINHNLVAYIPESSYSLESFDITIVNLTSHKEKEVRFKNKCGLSPEGGCIEKIIFEKNRVTMNANLIDEKQNTILESVVVEF